jgi:twitching motility protein PilT
MSNEVKAAGMILEAMQRFDYFTDLQMRPGEPCYVRLPRGYRALSDARLTAQDIEAFLSESVSPPDFKERLAAGQGHFDVSFRVQGRARLRAQVFRYGTTGQIGISLRKLALEPPSLEECGAPPYLKKFLTGRPGLILVAGPTGSGKTTTQAASLEYINQEQASHIVTIEQPIEYVLTGKKSIITQHEVPTVAPSFKVALERVLRQDPDVIMIGETLNLDTMSAALTAADSGHLVIATSHAKSPREAIERVAGYFPGEDAQLKRAILASSLTAVLCQVLIPSADSKRLVLAYDLVPASPAIADMIERNDLKGLANHLADARTPGLILRNKVLADLVRANKITREDALAHSDNTKKLQEML